MGVVILSCLPQAVHAARHALVIGNGIYENAADLRNPINDARDVASRLEELGYEVHGGSPQLNLDRRNFRRSVERFAEGLSSGDVAIIYYAGHGAQFEGESFLLPADDDGIEYLNDLPHEAINAEYIVEQVSHQSGVQLVLILDACRNSALPERGRSTGTSRGLSRIDAPSGVFIAYAAAPGQIANDGRGRNGVFTEAILVALENPYRPVEQVFYDVGAQVESRAANQIPWITSSLRQVLYIALPAERIAVVTEPENETAMEELEGSVGNNIVDEIVVTGSRIGRTDLTAVNTVMVFECDFDSSLTTVGALLASRRQCLELGQVFQDCDECPEMVVVPPGSFMMGSPETEEGREEAEGPQHRVRIGYAFAVGRFEVTFDQWDACVADGGCDGYQPDDEGWGRGRRPAINVSWNDAQNYVQWMSQETGQNYRLLSEAEWEYAARSGSASAYPWGDTTSHEYANYGRDSLRGGGLSQGRDRWVNTAPVGSFASNEFGLYDMIGNVWEWTEDCRSLHTTAETGYNGAPTDGSPWTAGIDCVYRAKRGGSWVNGLRATRSAIRLRSNPDSRHSTASGFRLARDLE